MGEKAVTANAEQFRVRVLKLREIIGQALVFTLTDRTPIQRIKTQHDVLLALIVAELDVLLILILQVEVGSGIAHLNFCGYVTHQMSSFAWLFS
jgi:hypothetical protein